MTSFQRMLQLPSARRRFTVPASKQRLPIIFLGWGLRRFGDEPVSIAQNFGFVYVLCVKGSPTLLTDQARYKLNTGKAMILDVDCPMGWYDTPAVESDILVWIWRDTPTLTQLQPEPGGVRSWHLNARKLAAIKRIHRECRKELALLDDFTASALQGQQRMLDVAILRAQRQTSDKSVGESRYEIGLNWMRRNLKAQRPVAELSTYLGVSESTLHRIFRRRTSQGPHAVFQAMKAEEAKRLIEMGEPIKAVAYQLGYRHANDFTRFYTNVYGYPPSQYEDDSASVYQRKLAKRRFRPQQRSSPSSR